MPIDPVAFRLFGMPIYWYGVMISLGMLLGTIVALRRVALYGVNEDQLLGFLLWAVPSAIVGARLVFVISNWSLFAGDFLSMLNIRQGGLAIHGGILGAVLAGSIYARMNKLQFWPIADVCAPGLILGQAIGRWGNFFNQEAYGVPTNMPWALYIDGAYRHPIFFYEFVWNLLVFGYLLYMTKREKTSGGIFLRYLIGYSIGRFIIEGFRADTLLLGPFRAGQLISIVLMLVGVLLLKWRKQQDNKERGALS